MFWRRWTKEYVPQLIKRQKWHKQHRNLRVGDVVLVADLRYPRGQWPLAVVTRVKEGRDGLIRTATVRTAKSTLTRPVTQLCLLESAADVHTYGWP